MYKLFSIFSISSLLQGHAVNRSLAFMSEIARTFKAVNRRALSTIGTTLMLSALLSACSSGGGGGSDAPAPAAPTTPTFSVSSSNFSIDEDFATPQLVVSVSNATAITVSQSNTEVVTVTTSNAQVNISSIANANGRTILTIRATNGAFSATTQVTVTVNAVNDPPTLAVSSNNISTVGGFSPITINTTASDIEDGALAFTVSESTAGVVRVGTSADAIILSNIPNASGQTTLAITAVDSSGSTVTQTIAVNVTITTSTSIPALSVSSNIINVQEDFTTSVVIRTTATDADGDTITLSVSPLRGIVNADISTSVISTNTITLSAVANVHGTATLTVLAADVGGQSTEVNIVVVVASVNDAPTLTIPTLDLVLAEDFVGARTVISAVDVDSNTLTVTVMESTTGVVTVTTSASSVSVSSILNANGQTTLTITVNDGTSDTTAQVVVDVTPVNDTPTLTVTSNAVTVGLDPVVLTVSAFDLEDSTLSFSVSTGHVNTAITTTSLTLTRLGLNASQIMLTLRTTDTANVSVSTVVTVALSPVLLVTTSIKTLNFAWSAITSATHYQLQSNPDGHSGFTDLSTTDIIVSPNSTNIRQTTAQALVALHRYIPNVRNPQYSVGTCNTASSCGPSFRHNTVSLTNAQLNSLIGRLQASNAGIDDLFGTSVSLSGDGNTLAVGAWNEDGSLTGVNGAQNNNSTDTGAVYVFRRIGGAWSQQAYIKASNIGVFDFFGFPVSLSSDGNTLAVGAISEDGSSIGVNGAQNDNAASFSGAVYVFRHIGGAWSQQAYIKASNTGRGDRFGASVSLNGNGNTLVVGAYGEDGSSIGVNGAQNNNFADTGAVYLFRFSTGSSTWSQQAYIKASNTGAGDEFGWSVSLSADGNTLAVGARNEDSSSTGVNGAQNNNSTNTGAVYLFRFNTTSSIWSQQAYIKASNTGSDDSFGHSVSLSANGNTLAVGAWSEDGSSTGVNGAQNNNSTNTGAVYLFRFNTGSSTWSQQAYIKASNTGGSDEFGESVSLSADGNTLAVGVPDEDGSATGVGGVDDNGTVRAGATYVFEFANGAWAQQTYIKATDPSSNAFFGDSVSLSSNGDTLAVGASAASSFAGAVYLY